MTSSGIEGRRYLNSVASSEHECTVGMHLRCSQCWQSYISRFRVQLFRVVIPFYTKPPVFCWMKSFGGWTLGRKLVSSLTGTSAVPFLVRSGFTSRHNSWVPLHLIVHNYELKKTFNKATSCTSLLPRIVIYYMIKSFGHKRPDILYRNTRIIPGRSGSTLLFGERVKWDYFRRLLGLARLCTSHTASVV
jgi:hypothetical protein